MSLCGLLRSNKGIVRPFDDMPRQVFYDRRIQLFQLIVGVLELIGPSDISVATFSCSEEFLRRQYLLRKDGYLLRSRLLVDSKALRKTMRLAPMMDKCYDEVWIGENHSKLVLLRSSSGLVSITTSQNQTRGNRLECSIVENDISTWQQLNDNYERALGGSRLVSGILRRRAERDREVG